MAETWQLRRRNRPPDLSQAWHRAKTVVETKTAEGAVIVAGTRDPVIATGEAHVATLQASAAGTQPGTLDGGFARASAVDAFSRRTGETAITTIGGIPRHVDTDPFADRLTGQRADTRSVAAYGDLRTISVIAAVCPRYALPTTSFGVGLAPLPSAAPFPGGAFAPQPTAGEAQTDSDQTTDGGAARDGAKGTDHCIETVVIHWSFPSFRPNKQTFRRSCHHASNPSRGGGAPVSQGDQTRQQPITRSLAAAARDRRGRVPTRPPESSSPGGHAPAPA
jgi:hypothetical protein